MPSETATFLTLPRELRNTIYLHIFSSSHDPKLPSVSQHQQLHNNDDNYDDEETDPTPPTSPTPTPSNGASDPPTFAQLTSPLRPIQLQSLRHLTLTARINALRSLNETWCSLPFGCPDLQLEKLTIIPLRPDCFARTAYAEVADLSQSHTLAYIFAETLKG
ncbi:hypothetical protein BTJ68_13306 [Hortaea werneckii EXF-2000]|uniref:Uncharacterized protein n=1 Tax=Hortaea werneckii EXF-2000 TaxID=1157616 RepID=A0A1Z5SRD8_HORWE|nr:hypothetical protein BTJ68_13306 [Hortaea werneckii EXF-2000]